MSTFHHVATQAAASASASRIVTTFAYFLALAAAVGGTWTYLTVVRPAIRRSADIEPQDAARLRARALRIAAIGTSSLLGVAYFRLASRVARARDGMTFGEALAPSNVRAFISAPARSGQWVAAGDLLAAQNVFIVLAALVMLPALFGRITARTGRSCALAAVLVVAASAVVSIPTTAPNLDSVAQGLLYQVHVVGVALWVGGLAALTALALTRGHLRQSAANAWAVIWERFGVFAMLSVGGVLLSGVWLTYLTVGAFEQFFTTTFGRLLLLKIVIVLAMLTAGAYNQLVLTPRIARARRAGDTPSVFRRALAEFPRVVVTEVVLGVAVLLVVPFINGSARSEAAGHAVQGPAFDGRLFLVGLLLLVTLALSLYATERASVALGLRDDVVPDADRVSS